VDAVVRSSETTSRRSPQNASLTLPASRRRLLEGNILVIPEKDQKHGDASGCVQMEPQF